ncbi:ParB N-terminal domain-containing protein [Candidatus Margulisiibacteriota bacterium]
MNHELLDINKIKIQNSKYHICQPSEWKEDDPSFKTMAASLKQLGQLTPVIVTPNPNGKFDLADGFIRILFAIKNNQKQINCCILPKVSNPVDILNTILPKYLPLLNSSPITKIKFLKFCMNLELKPETIMNNFFPALDLNQNPKIWQTCLDISSLPKIILDFLEEKKFPFKICAYLTKLPLEILQLLLSLKTELNLTYSNFLELSENINDYLSYHELPLENFVQDPEFKSILASNKNNHEKTICLRELLSKKRYPTVHSVNYNIETIYKKLGLPKNVRLSWDKTLEEKALQLQITIKNNHELPTIMNLLSQKENQFNINSILDQL